MLRDLNEPELAPVVYDWIEDMLAAGQVLPPPARLRAHVYERFVASPDGDNEPIVSDAECVFDRLDRLDPVCLMDVDPATAKHTAAYAGRTIAFCAPSCKKQFLADPSAYISAPEHCSGTAW